MNVTGIVEASEAGHEECRFALSMHMIYEQCYEAAISLSLENRSEECHPCVNRRLMNAFELKLIERLPED